MGEKEVAHELAVAPIVGPLAGEPREHSLPVNHENLKAHEHQAVGRNQRWKWMPASPEQRGEGPAFPDRTDEDEEGKDLQNHVPTGAGKGRARDVGELPDEGPECGEPRSEAREQHHERERCRGQVARDLHVAARECEDREVYGIPEYPHGLRGDHSGVGEKDVPIRPQADEIQQSDRREAHAHRGVDALVFTPKKTGRRETEPC